MLPLGLQQLGLVIGALIVAQLVTLALTILIPPAPVQRWNLDVVAESLLGKGDGDMLDRKRMNGPPDISQPGWLVSESSREALAKQVNRPVNEVVLAFYTQLPVGGTAVPMNVPSARWNEASHNSAPIGFSLWENFVGVAYAQAGPGGAPPPGGMPGGGFPGGGAPGGGPPGGNAPGGSPGRGVPGGGIPGGNTPGGNAPGGVGGISAGASSSGQPPAGNSPTGVQAAPMSANPQPVSGTLGMQGMPSAGPARPPIATPATAGLPLRTPQSERSSLPQSQAPIASAVEQPVITYPSGAVTPDTMRIFKPAGRNTMILSQPVGTPRPIPFRQSKTVLSFTTPPFIEGDFIAAMRQADGSWIAVAPKAEPFPNSWQKRVMLWFALSLLVVAPLVWLFTRRLVKPLESFADAAETLGRDPSATVMPLSGTAEIGRAARAFNQMRDRLRAFVDDRTAMVGAISHDLRTPLTRMRFRLEDVPDEQREELLADVDEMELMIGQVIAFIRDASTPGARERVDLATLVESTIVDARLTGNDIELETSGLIPVEVDPVGIRRLLANLLENAVKYGEHARVRVALQGEAAIAEVIDDGPGIPEDERERVFEPFFRCEQHVESDKPGSGLGLAVCRSIARAHGGDVCFEQRAEGFVASLTLPALCDGPLRRAA